MRRCVWVGTEGRRLHLFRNALESSGSFEGIVVVPFRSLISGTISLCDLIEEGDVVRIESPGKDFELERDILRLGISDADVERSPVTGYVAAALGEEELNSLVFDRGLILTQTQWYRGWCRLLDLVESQLKISAPHTVTNGTHEIKILFDKIRCHEVFGLAGVKMPIWLGPINNFEHLIGIMDQTVCNRVFIKPAHSSSASGIVAFERNGKRQIATTTVETVRRQGKTYLYNSRRVRKISDANEIRELVDRLSEHNLFAEKWYPKAGINGKTFDLRVVTVAGQCRNVVVRESLTPFTNLHLLNGRGQLNATRTAMGENLWSDVMRSCRKVASAFPKCLYLGIDVLVGADMRNHVVAEANAFGDLLPGVLYDGMSTYEWELRALEAVLNEAKVNA